MQNRIIKGIIVEGAKKGRSFGFPTANIILPKEYALLENGVYAVEITIGEEKFKGMANIGVHPTVGNSPAKLLEVNIFDFSRDIYGETVTVKLGSFVRPEQKFNNLNELIAQIKEDKKQIEKLIKI